MLVETLSDANAQRKSLQERLQHEREAAARIAGELDAARASSGDPPTPELVFPSERRFEIAASMEPAREVGGDLYDFFMLDDERLFFLVGDVSGKPAREHLHGGEQGPVQERSASARTADQRIAGRGEPGIRPARIPSPCS